MNSPHGNLRRVPSQTIQTLKECVCEPIEQLETPRRRSYRFKSLTETYEEGLQVWRNSDMNWNDRRVVASAIVPSSANPKELYTTESDCVEIPSQLMFQRSDCDCSPNTVTVGLLYPLRQMGMRDPDLPISSAQPEVLLGVERLFPVSLLRQGV